MAVGGDSAGGNLAAVVCLSARDAAGPKLAAQFLFYPATDFDMDTPSHTLFAEGYLLTRSTMRWFHEKYLSGPADKADWRASPLKAERLADLPPAYVVPAGYAPLPAEAVASAPPPEKPGGLVPTPHHHQPH